MSIKSSSSNNGVFVIRVNSDGPAAQAGIKPGDTICSINNLRIINDMDFFKSIGY